HIHTVHFVHHSNESLNALLPAAIQGVKSFKSLKHIVCTSLPLEKLKIVFADEYPFLHSIRVYGVYSSLDMVEVAQFIATSRISIEIIFIDMDTHFQYQIDTCVTQNQTDKLALAYDELGPEALLDLTYGEDRQLNLQNKLQLMYGHPKRILLSSLFYSQYQTYMDRYITEKSSLESIILSADWDEASLAKFIALLPNALNLKYIRLGDNHLNTAAINTLTITLQTLPIQALELQFSKFLDSASPLWQVIRQHQHLVFLKFHAESPRACLDEIHANQSLLAIDASPFCLPEDTTENLHKMVSRNARTQMPLVLSWFQSWHDEAAVEALVAQSPVQSQYQEKEDKEAANAVVSLSRSSMFRPKPVATGNGTKSDSKPIMTLYP
ncbi:MAG: hypothetical protein ACHP65_02300, partial [Legionellales bacterium]